MVAAAAGAQEGDSVDAAGADDVDDDDDDGDGDDVVADLEEVR
jgi:hypothetical protein